MIRVLVLITKVIITIATTLLFLSCNFKKVDGSGEVLTENRPATAEFDAVSAASGLEVIIVQGGQRAITVEADDNLHQHIKTEINNGVLEVSADVNIGSAKAKRVTVTMPVIKGLEASSGSSVKNKSTLTADAIDLTSDSGASMDVTLEAKEITCESGSGSSLTVHGKADKLETSVSSGATLNTAGLVAKDVKAEASSGGNSKVNPVEKLTANASSGGSVKYVNTPNSLDKKTSSGGNVSQN